jgi:hypothetical protein
MIGSSILIIFDDNNECGAWLIDFTKTMLMTDKTLTHRDPWVLGNHEACIRLSSPKRYY